MWVCAYVWRSEEGIVSLKALITGVCEPLNTHAENKAQEQEK